MKRKIAVADAETDPFEWMMTPQPFTFGYYDGDEYVDFWGDDAAVQFAEFIRDKHVYCYFHNGGKFDLFYLLEFMEPELMTIQQRIAECQIGEAKFRDSYLILPLPLAAYKKDDFQYWKLKRLYRERYKDEILRYQYHDCVYLYEWVRKFTDRFGTNLTLASSALKQLRKTDYEVKRTVEDTDTKFRPYYFGGRTQCFQTGRHDGPIDYYDINSAYPFAMLHKHPRGHSAMVLDRLPNVTAPYFATIDAVSHGALPYRNGDGSTEFPSDDEVRRFNVTGWEIEAGLETGTLFIKNVIICHLFTDCADFTDYVNSFYAEKLEAKKLGDKDTELFSKLMLNSCYGKFGQDARKYTECQIREMGELPSEAAEDVRKLYGMGYEWFVDEWGRRLLPEGVEDADMMVDRGWYKVSETETDHVIWEKPTPGDKFYNVATAASITGFVRAYLWRAICRSDNVLYCDTDSVMAGSFDGPIGDELGEWSREAILKHVWIGGKKLYAALTEDEQWKVASKGVRLTPLDIQRIVENRETIKWRKDAPAFSLSRGTSWIEREISMTGV